MSAQATAALSPPSLLGLPGMPGMPIGYHAIHADLSLNFQMNRWFSWVGDLGMLEEMRTVAPRIATYADWQREFAALASKPSPQGRSSGPRITFVLRSSSFCPTTRNADRCASSSCN